MLKKITYQICIVFLFCLCVSHIQAQGNMSFIENNGQWLDNIQYKSDLNFGNIFFEKDNFTFILLANEEHNHNSEHFDEKTEAEIKGHHYKIKFLDANNNVSFKTENKSNHYYNFFLGNDHSKWATNVFAYRVIEYQNLYDGINMKVFGDADNMKYEYYVAPFQNPDQIKVQYIGIDDLKLNHGNLVYKTSVAGVTELKPIVYQFDGDIKTYIECNYKLNKKNKTVQFEFPNGYDESKELIIDPTLIFTSYSASTLNNFGFTATYDNDGNLFGGGIIFTNGSGLTGYPSINSFNLVDTTSGTNQPNFNTGYFSDIAISKFSDDGSTLLYSTLIGGMSNEQPQSLVTDSSGNLYIYARTNSPNYPVTSSAYDTSYNGGMDIVITKISSAGNTLMSSTFVGGSGDDGSNMSPSVSSYSQLKYNYADDGRGEIIIDENDNVYVTSSTQSNDIFPDTTAFQGIFGGGLQDACVFKLNNDLSSLKWGSYLGGSINDAGYSVKVDKLGNVFVTGGTNSIDFPGTANGLIQNFQGGRADGFIAKIDTSGNTLFRSTYLGTSSYDQSFFIEIDEFNDVYTFGQSTGAYPVIGNVYSNSNSSQFIHKLNNDIDTTLFSTVFGSGDTTINISPTAFLVDFCGNIYISGWGGTTNLIGNTNGMPLTSDAFQATTDGSDFYIMVLDKDAENLLYGTYFGGNQIATGGSGEHVDGGTSRFDKNGIIYQAVCASCGTPNNNFPTTAGAWSQTDNSIGGGCNLGVIKMEVYIPPTIVDVQASPTATGCVPLLVNFESNLVNVNKITWDFGDGFFSNLEDPVHLFTDTGTYNIMLIGQDTTLCNLADTAFLKVVVDDDTLVANFIDNTNINCEDYSVSVTTDNYSTTEYLWTMGDGNSYTTDSVFHIYASPGIYDIKLVITDSTSCELIDSSQSIIEILPSIIADFTLTDTFGCNPLNLNFSNQINIQVDSFYWDFGDGNFSNVLSPNHTYIIADTFDVALISLDSNSCNLSDTAKTQIIVSDDSLFADIQVDTMFFDCDSLVLRFSSLNSNIISHNWDFGNGISSTDSTVIIPFQAAIMLGISTFNVIYFPTDSNLFCRPIDTANFQIKLKPEFIFSATISDSIGCSPLYVGFSAFIDYPMDSFIWDFGDGNTSEFLGVGHTYNVDGDYNVSFLTYDTNTCNISDSIHFLIQVDNDTTIANVVFQENFFNCDSLQILATSNNLNSSHFWDFGDGFTSNLQTISHTYETYGDFDITYIVYDSTKACNPYDTAFYSVHFDEIEANVNIVDSFGCIPFTINYSTSSTAESYFWQFDDGNNSTTSSGSHIYTLVDSYNISLLVVDSTSCNIFDTAYAIVYTENTKVEAVFDDIVLNSCDSLLIIQLDNQSINADSYEWYFNGTGLQTIEEPGNASFNSIGTHEILLIAINDTLCNERDTVIKSYDLLPNLTANFRVENNCENQSIDIENNSLLGTNFTWNFGEGSINNLEEPSFSYSESGNYYITLTVIDSSSCNVTNSFTQTIEILDYAIANFETDSSGYEYPADVSFTNLSSSYTNFIWEFGDGETESLEENPVHSYKIVYDVEPCLSVWNEFCGDTICKNIYIDFIQLIGVPNAFSPNSDGVNDVIYVEGIGIETMLFKIYNRWGELVFESKSQELGWDGKYNNIDQELEVYTYTLEATFINNESATLNGNITLLR